MCNTCDFSGVIQGFKTERAPLCEIVKITDFGMSFVPKKLNFSQKGMGAGPRAPLKISVQSFFL